MLTNPFRIIYVNLINNDRSKNISPIYSKRGSFLTHNFQK